MSTKNSGSRAMAQHFLLSKHARSLSLARVVACPRWKPPNGFRHDRQAHKRTVENIPSIAGEISTEASANAPFFYFEGAPFYGYMGGVGKMVIEISRQITLDPGSGVLVERVVVGHLLGKLDGMRPLKTAIEGILFMA
ncbi:hypothetical protein CCR94_03320 [Rhodoblastus sphagnicola]|uniref:Uncharacterized protein n=1 Tax=Rhodoblastus sphagnicola TaxID=333368 RepID=A0A2S6NEB2_9HYPH|nr:hypothetical protein CCR94_03320 [Rhodoblastus sphagnicola]